MKFIGLLCGAGQDCTYCGKEAAQLKLLDSDQSAIYVCSDCVESMVEHYENCSQLQSYRRF